MRQRGNVTVKALAILLISIGVGTAGGYFFADHLFTTSDYYARSL